MLFGQCPHGGGDKLKGASLTGAGEKGDHFHSHSLFKFVLARLVRYGFSGNTESHKKVLARNSSTRQKLKRRSVNVVTQGQIILRKVSASLVGHLWDPRSVKYIFFVIRFAA